MAYDLAPFHDIPLDESLLELLIAEHESLTLPRLRRLWSYYRNALAEPTSRGSSMGPPFQAIGLPPRLDNGDPVGGVGEEEENGIPHLQRTDRARRDIVIENDIAWRIHTLVDFMFPESPRIISKASDPNRASRIEAILNAVFTANGGTALWQDAALLGSVYGHVDFLLDCQQLERIGKAAGRGIMQPRRQGGGDDSRAGANHLPAPAPAAPDAPDAGFRGPDADVIAPLIVIETVEATRAIPLLNRSDYRIIDAYILHFDQLDNDVDHAGLLARLSRALRLRRHAGTRRATTNVTEIITASHCQRYENEQLVMETVNRLGRIPLVHVQNLSQPLVYSGISDVEPLIPLQDELNTRLSDRANRVTMQSFRMWLGKGIDGFTDRPVGPGQMWVTDNMEASIESFGGDADSPSERAHIEELREALDKASGVTPAAAGHIRARVGNLTSENALRISLMGTIAKTKRKRVTYGSGIAQLCELVLHALDVYGVYRSDPRERGIEIVWTDPIASDESRRIADALAKAQLGVPASVLRLELGYPDPQPA